MKYGILDLPNGDRKVLRAISGAIEAVEEVITLEKGNDSDNAVYFVRYLDQNDKLVKLMFESEELAKKRFAQIASEYIEANK